MGFVERLHVRATQDRVALGAPLADIYVPSWVAAQEEYLAVARMAEQDDAAAAFKVAQEQLHTLMARHELELRQRTDRQVLELQAMEARVAGAVKQAQAFSPELTAALLRLGDAQLLSSLAENFGGLAAVEGKALLETARKFLDFVPGSMLPVLKAPGQGSVVVPQAAEKTSG